MPMISQYKRQMRLSWDLIMLRTYLLRPLKTSSRLTYTSPILINMATHGLISIIMAGKYLISFLHTNMHLTSLNSSIQSNLWVYETESPPRANHSVLINATSIDSSVGLKLKVPESTVVRTGVKARQAAVTVDSEYQGHYNVTGSYSYVYWSRRRDPSGRNRTKEIVMSNSTTMDTRTVEGRVWWVENADREVVVEPPALRNTIDIVGSGSAVLHLG